MTRRRIAETEPEVLSRKRTAEMLRRLRALTGQVKMLKARLDRERTNEERRQVLRSRKRRDD